MVVFSEFFLKLTPNSTPPPHLQLLKNIFRVCWKWKNTDIICYKLTSLVSLSQGNVKKSKKLIKIDENSQYCQRKSPYLLNDLWNFNDIFRNDVAYDNIKSHKNQEFTISSADTFLKKPQEGSNCPPAFLGLRIFPWPCD